MITEQASKSLSAFEVQPMTAVFRRTTAFVTLLARHCQKTFANLLGFVPNRRDQTFPEGLKHMQQTLILLKPDCVHRRLIGTIIQRFEQKGLRLVALKLVQASRQLAEQHYAVHKGKPFYDSLLQFLTAGPTVAMVWEGREAVTVARTLMGPTDGTKAPPATIRGDFAISVQNNLVHGSDSPDNAAAEIKLWFKPEELVNYTPVDGAWVAGA
jgi:nucleoside-diphosphate kinase